MRCESYNPTRVMRTAFVEGYVRNSAVHPWVSQFRDQIGWGVQAVPRTDDADPSRTLLRAGLLVEEVGFDGFFVGDHPAYALEAWLHLAALAVQTTRIRLGSIVLCTGYRPPVVTARLIADLDNLSHGRAILGLGHGWNASEFSQLGLPFPPVPERQAALAEAIEIIKGVLGDSPFTYRGAHHRTEGARVEPAPRQDGGVPLVLAGAGERTALRLVARYADACNYGPGHATGLTRTPDEVRRKNDVLDQYCAEAGRDPRSVLRTHFISWVMLAPSEGEAQAKLNQYYPHGLNEEQRYSRLAAGPERAIAHYQELVDAGMDYFVAQTQDASDTETIEILARDVIPFVQKTPRSGC
jgi:alkanesulfonate monooxygenase SsuD/methylene tetrahydromethanopterin reductase-like flavin-dependent oxidoreductase (luciferase family)